MKKQQFLLILTNENRASAALYEKKENDYWQPCFWTAAQIGKNGIGKEREGDKKTPRGLFAPAFAFGIAKNPGAKMPYVQLDDSHYWIDDSQSAYYNRFVSTRHVQCDWTHGEHLIEHLQAYQYAIALNYNEDCVPGKGSALFIHCFPTNGAGCIVMPQRNMIQLLTCMEQNCTIAIFEKS